MRKVKSRGIVRRFIYILIVIIIVLIGINTYFSNLDKNSRTDYTTSITMDQIKEIAKLSTIEYLVEARVEIDDKEKLLFSIPIPGTKKTYIAVAQGQVTAGIDMEKLKYFKVQDGKVEIQLPKAEILYKSIDPSTKWEREVSGVFVHVNSEEITKAEIKAQDDMVDRALNDGILEKADNNAKKIITNFLKTAGIKEVIFK